MKKIFLFLFLLPALFVQAQTQITCAQAREYALSVSQDNELYNGGEVYVVQGYVTHIQIAWDANWKNVSFWMADDENGGKVIEAYRCVANTKEEAPNLGSYVRVTGQLTKYGSTPEFTAGCTCEILSNTEPPVNLGYKTIAEFIELANSKDTCILKGVITSIASTQYGNLYMEDHTASIYVFGLTRDASGNSIQFSQLGLEEGDTLTISGIYQLYGSTHEVVSARYISSKKPETDEKPVVYSTLRVCAQNLQNYYFNYSEEQTSRPSYHDEEGFRAKTQKIVNAMLDIDADIYAFCEVEAKPIVLAQLADSMNVHAGVPGLYAPVYDGIDYTWYEGIADNQIKSGFIYRTDRVSPLGDNTGAVSGYGYYARTMRIQAFKQNSSKEALVLSMNHFKAKDSSADQGEEMRQINANNLVNALPYVTTDPDVLILGDLNCEYGEAPISTIIDAGFEEQILRFDSTAYSHCYDGGELIDHALANPSLKGQIVNAYVKHVCTWRCTDAVSSSDSYSDHDPYIVEMVLGNAATVVSTDAHSSKTSVRKEIRHGQLFIIRGGETFTITGQRVY